jgi:Kef-type K+ transport system membrane component KefB
VDNKTAQSLLVIAAVAVLAPLLAELLRRWRVPGVLFELLLGILVGPSVMGLAEVGTFVEYLSVLGLSYLFFLAGYEIDFARLKGTPMRRAGVSWAVTLVLALAVGVVLMLEGAVLSALLVGLCLTSTALGTLLPMLRDRELLDTRFGTILTAAGSVGEFAPIVAVTLLLSSESPLQEALLMLAFVLVALGLAYMAGKPQPPRFVEVMQRHLTTSSQLPVRLVLFMVVVMVVLAAELGLDTLLGAFSAGLIARLVLRNSESEALMPRLESIGFGFLIPAFFIVSGMKFDAEALVEDPTLVLRALGFLALMLAVRGLPALLTYRGVIDLRSRTALAFLQATALPLVVVITEIGLSTHRMRPDNATALVAAGMLSVLVFPLSGLAVLGQTADSEAVVADSSADADA